MPDNDLPLVTIVTPTYNQADYLRDTIESVLAQTYPNVEYIVIDDGSTDGTKEILDAYRNKCTIIQQVNRGQSSALNRAWSSAKGVILGYISSDDWLKPDCIMRAVEVMLKDATVVGVYCDFDLIDNDGKYIRTVATEDFDRNRLLVDLICQPGPGAFFYKSAFEKVGGWKPSLRQVPDFDFWVRISGEGDMKRIPLPLADFRIHEKSSSFRPVSRERSEEIINVVESYVELYLDEGLKSHALSNAHAFCARSHFQSLRFACGVRSMYLSFKKNPKGYTRLSRWRFIVSGMIRRFWYLFLKS